MTLAEEMRLIHTVDRYFNVSITNKSRRREFLDIKHAFRFVMREMGYGFTDIGRMIGCQHATVIHSYKMAVDLIETEPDFSKIVNVMKSVISDFHVSYRIKTRKMEMERKKSMVTTFCVLLNEVKDYVGEDGVKYWLHKAKLEQHQFDNIIFVESILEEA